MTEPTDAELLTLIEAHLGLKPRRDDTVIDQRTGRFHDVQRYRDFARAVLQRWGQPSGAGEVDRADAVNLARNCLGAYNCAITKKGIRVLAEAVLSMDAALSTPQPTQAQAGAVPLTDEFVNKVVRSKQPHLDTDTPAWGKNFEECKYWLEAASGIKGGQHG